MRKLLKRFAVPLLCVCTAMILTGCFEDEITFKGKVFWATVDYKSVGTEVKEILTVQGPLVGARVKVAGHQEIATTDSDGNYAIKIDVPRVIGLSRPKGYWLQAWSPVWLPSPAKPGADEIISMYAHARPGDTCEVRSFVLYEHTHEDQQPVVYE